MSAARDEHAKYGSHLDFYQAAYPAAVREVRGAGRVGATLFEAEQTAGDWSDAPSPDLTLAIVIRHACNIVIDQGAGRARSSAGPGCFCLTPPHVATTILADGSHNMRLLAIPYRRLLEFTGPDSGLPLDGDFGSLHVGVHRDHEVAIALAQLWQEAAEGNLYGALRVDGLLLQFAARLLQLADQQRASRPARVRLSPAALRRVQEAIADRLDADLALDQLAAIAGLSAFHFARAFKADTGLPPHRYLVARRMEHARELLQTTELPIIEVAARVGYGDPAHFAKLFRREVGTTPSSYRQRWRL